MRMAMANNVSRSASVNPPSKLVCIRCGEKIDTKKYYSTRSEFFKNYGRLPICQECLDEMYDRYYEKYSMDGKANPEYKAVERICMMFDVYYSEKLVQSAKKSWEKDASHSLLSYYLQRTRLKTYIQRSYDDTLKDKYKEALDAEKVMSIYDDDDVEKDSRIQEGVKMFGNGFAREDYVFLYNKYMEWTARHECNTMAQEETFKQLCKIQLQQLKAETSGNIGDIKQLNEQYLKLMDAAKLQPKQNVGDTTAENQTMGTLIDKWERTRPIPEPEEDLRDVDKIGLYIDVFFRGHLAKMVNIKNAFSNLYDKFMSKYTASKPEYVEDDDDESMFEAVFGKANLEEDIPEYHFEDDGME